MQLLRYSQSSFSATRTDPDKTQPCQKNLFDSNKDFSLGSHSAHFLTDYILWLCTVSHFTLWIDVLCLTVRYVSLYSLSWLQAVRHFSLYYMFWETIQLCVTLCVRLINHKIITKICSHSHITALPTSPSSEQFNLSGPHVSMFLTLQNSKAPQ